MDKKIEEKLTKFMQGCELFFLTPGDYLYWGKGD